MRIKGRIKVDCDGDIVGCEHGCGNTDEYESGQRVLDLAIDVPEDFFDAVPVSVVIAQSEEGVGDGKVNDGDIEVVLGASSDVAITKPKSGWYFRGWF